MGKQYVENTGNSPLWVGGAMIMPGEGREVVLLDEASAPPDEPEIDPDAALHELLAGTVAEVSASLEGLQLDTLNRLQALEADGKNRKGVLEAVANAAIALADAALKSDDLA